MFKFGVAALLSALTVEAKDGSDFNDATYIGLSASAKSDKIWAKVAESQKSGGWHFAGTLVVD